MNPYRIRILFIIIISFIGIGYVFWKPLSVTLGMSDAKDMGGNILPVKLGLDLQGGMRVVMEVDIVKMFEDLAKNKDEKFLRTIESVRQEASTSEENVVSILQRKFAEQSVELAVYFGDVQERDNETIITKLQTEATTAIDRAIEIVRNRVDQYGVSEPTIQKQGGTRIIVELPGVKNESQVRTLLQGTALLEFKLLKEPESVAKLYESINKTLALHYGVDTSTVTPVADSSNDTSKSLASTDSASQKKDTSGISPSAQTKSEEQLRKENPFFALVQPPRQDGNEGYVGEEFRDSVNHILQLPEIQKILPSDVQFHWAAKPIVADDGKEIYALFCAKKEPELTGGVIENANVDFVYNQPVVNMQMSSEGAREWARITGANVNKRIAIILDRGVYSAPVVRSKITGGNSQIEGMDMGEAQVLQIVLKAGALPAPVDIIQQQSVGASLGADSIQKGLLSAILAFVLTALFIMVYYSFSGVVANIALVLNLIFMIVILAGFQGTLTLPGIAGIILSMAVAVDANVLINERIHEELASGKTTRAAVDAGYKKAFTAIFDSNITTFITGIILYQFGSGPIQGFALTLMIGIVVSMITAIWATHIIFNAMLTSGKTVNFG
ncbi:MAG: protein translocase subunit SecD [Ignavibacteriales bacterium]|nr:protein translocase subunit SecD [Ignavibacteriales bacterium]